jgi:glycosyltransferase involved in cell wall biosynthesis
LNPSITIITAVYNGSSTIADCLTSVNSQTMPVEHSIIDGASTDNSLELVRRISPHARILSEPDEGIYDAMNKGIRIATGDVIGILNADDFYASPDVLARVAAVFKDPSVDCCYGDLIYVNEIIGKGTRAKDAKRDFTVTRYWKSGKFHYKRFYWGWMPPHPTFFVRRQVYEQHGLFNPNLGSAADYELMLRFLLKKRIKAVYIPEILVKMRAGGVSNASVRNRFRAHMNDRRAWRINDLRSFPWTLYLKPTLKLRQWLLRPPKFDK